MNNRAKKQNEEQVRRWIRNIIREDRQSSDRPVLLEFGGPSWMSPEDGYNTWIAPFANVLKVAKVATKDILSSAKLNLDLLLTFSPEKMEKLHKEWAGRKQKIDAEYAKVMEPINKALDTGDAAMIAFMLNPAGFVGAKMVKKGVDAGVGVVGTLEDAGFDTKIPTLLGLGAAAEATAEPDEKGPIAGALHGLAKLFFIAHHAPAGNILAEAEDEEKAEAPEGDIQSQVDDYFEKLGILDKMESDASGMVETKLKIIEDVMSDSRAKFEILDGLYKATNAAEFKQALEKAKASGADIGGGGLQALGKEMQKTVDDMLSNPETKKAMIAAVAGAKGGKVKEAEEGEEAEPEVDEDKLRSHVEQVIFMQSKQPLQEKIFDGVKEMSKAAMEVVMEDMPPEEDWKVMSDTPLGKSLVDGVKAAVAEIEK